MRGGLPNSCTAKPDVCFNALHGRCWEDGCVQVCRTARHSLYAFGRVAWPGMHNERPTGGGIRAAGVRLRLQGLARAEAPNRVLPALMFEPSPRDRASACVIVRGHSPPQSQDRAGYGASLASLHPVATHLRLMVDRRLVYGNRAAETAWLLQLRVQVRSGRLAPLGAGADFTKCLPIGAEVNLHGSQGIGVPGRFARGLSLRRHGGRIGRSDLPGGQHAARHDGDLAGAGTGPTRRALVCRLGELDGGGGQLQQVGAGPGAERRADRPPALSPALRLPAPGLQRRPSLALRASTSRSGAIRVDAHGLPPRSTFSALLDVALAYRVPIVRQPRRGATEATGRPVLASGTRPRR